MISHDGDWFDDASGPISWRSHKAKQPRPENEVSTKCRPHVAMGRGVSCRNGQTESCRTSSSFVFTIRPLVLIYSKYKMGRAVLLREEAWGMTAKQAQKQQNPTPSAPRLSKQPCRGDKALQWATHPVPQVRNLLRATLHGPKGQLILRIGRCDEPGSLPFPIRGAPKETGAIRRVRRSRLRMIHHRYSGQVW